MSDEDMAPGVPSNRVLGVPVAAAMNPLPDNCCEAACGKSILTPAGRLWLWRACVIIALVVLMLGTVADSLGSSAAVWNASGFIDSKVLQQSGEGMIPDYYLNRCTKTGVPPTNVSVSFWFAVIAGCVTLLGTVSTLYVGRGCQLCCVLCEPCDNACRTNSFIGFSVLFGALSLPLFAWVATIGFKDIEQCRACFDMEPSECAAGFHLELQHTGVASAAAACGCFSLILAGAYCRDVPLAVKHAIRYKARNLMALSGSFNLNAYINGRAALAPPNLIPSQRDEVLSRAASTALLSHGAGPSASNTPGPSPYVGPSPYMGHQASPWRTSHPSPGLSYPSPGLSHTSGQIPEISLGRPATSVPPYTAGTPPAARPAALPPRASPMLTVQARPDGAPALGDSPGGGRPAAAASPIRTATPVHAFAQPPVLESSMGEREGGGASA
eukprot:CAMPEP_0174926496 /NCGR_PEP_ID=MMETSP1355-20121228/11633_1 /TAXON_ID=464990 /ORGANISM="Hemiselmis tepida, Strain CCMP443" /LENGTH=440 /DNA_ID=CAMNT_0016172531 /DNA_START=247 /DNA_END=1566 /DNA_ORIENTATION=+